MEPLEGPDALELEARGVREGLADLLLPAGT